MGKRGQIYILAAILLAVVIYGLSTVVNVVQQEEIRGDFEALSSNYEMESSKLINSVLQSGGDINDSFANFTFLFSSYSKSKSPGFNLFYALVHKDNIHFGNFMSENMIVYIPCPSSASCSAPSETTIAGCLANISAQVSFEGLNVGLNPDWDQAFNTILKPVCIKTLPIGANKEYCLNIGGEMYNLSIEPNVPKIFSFSRLKSGDQVLSSAQGDIGQERVCTGRDSESECCSDFCCWDEEEDDCREGKCATPEKCDGTIPCKKCYCDVGGEYCEWGSRLCKKPCDDGTRIGKCSTTKPKYCDSNKILLDKCGECDCPDNDWTCQSSGSCCVKEGKSCDASRPCCPGHYCDTDNKCKDIAYFCDDGTSGGQCSAANRPWYCKTDGSWEKKACKAPYNCPCPSCYTCHSDGSCKLITCSDSTSCGSCSATKPKYCDSGNLVNKCGTCGCPSGYSCKADGSCAVSTCSDGTSYGSCSATKPKYCDSGNLVNKCSVCGCPSGYYCQADGSCKKIEKKFLCRSEYWTGWSCCAFCGCPSCSSGYTNVKCDSTSCGFFSCCRKYHTQCRKDYWTLCSESPSCGGDAKIEEQTC